jgi:acyl-CoA synthetase (NDP forming)
MTKIAETRITEFEAKKILARHGIPVTREFLAKNPQQARKFAQKIRYPVALKIQSPDILHKTDAGGVILGVRSGEEASKGYEKIIANAKKFKKNAKILGVLVEEMVGDGHQCIVGSKNDPQFGPVLMFGLGGIFVELLKDVSFRIIPITRKDAKEMISEIKGYPILKGARGQKPVNFRALENTLIKVSNMVWKERGLEELDINPLFVGPKGVKAADARIIMSK